MLSHKMDFNCCANRDGFRRDSHIYIYIIIKYAIVLSLSTLVLNSRIDMKKNGNRNLRA